MRPPDSDLVSALPLVVVLAVLGVVVLRSTRGGPAETRLYLASFGLRFAASLLIYEAGFVETIGDEDAQEWIGGWYVKRSWEMYGVGILDLPLVLLNAYDAFNVGYMFFLAAVYMIWDVGDPGRLVAAVVNGCMGAMTAVLVYRAARELFDEKIGLLAGWLTCLFPSLIAWSAQTIKEPIVILLGTFLLYMCLRLFKVSAGSIPAYLLAAAVAALLIIPFRLYGGYIGGAVVVLTLLLRAMMAASPSARRTVGVVGVLGGVATAALMIAVFTELETKFVDFTYLMKVRDYSATIGGSSVQLPFDVTTPIGFVLSSIVGALHVMFAPFPWQWFGGSTRLVFTVPEVLAWWVIFYIGVWPGIRRALRERFIEVLPVLLFLVCFGFVYSAMFGNVGLAYRQRAQLLPWLLIFAAVGLRDRWDRIAAFRRDRRARSITSRGEILPA